MAYIPLAQAPFSPDRPTEMTMFKRFALSALTLAALQSAPALSMAQAADVVAKPIAAAKITYLVTGQDLRKCAFPFCGGYYVKAVNQPLTKCTDGSYARSCHAVLLNTDALGWTDEQRAKFQESFGAGKALVQGNLAKGDIQGISADVLTVYDAWQGQTARKPAGSFYVVRDTGIRCITTPCPSLSAQLLNSAQPATTPDLDLSATGATDEQIAATGPALGTSGVFVAGSIVSTRTTDLTGKVRKGSKLVASEFYLPAKP
jgi:hypothetical protein